jgi:two-component system sensor histidine kinase DegS
MQTGEIGHGDFSETPNSASASIADAGAALELQERERLRIGFDLHDGPVQTLASALLVLRMVQESHSGEDGDALAEVERLLASALDEMYVLIDDLHGRPLDVDGLVDSLREHSVAFIASSGISVNLSVDGIETAMSRSLRIALFRIVQEALSNVKRHSGATNVDIHLELSEDAVCCTVADNGSGFFVGDEVTIHGQRECCGLMGMRERAQLLDGVCDIESIPGVGTTVIARIPIWRG